MEQHSVSDKQVKGLSLPMIDFSPWTSEASYDRRLETALNLVEGCRQAGFVYISNHGIPQSVVEQAFAWAKKFFDLPFEDKLRAERKQDSLIFRGYNALGVQKVPRTLRVRGGDPTAKGWSPDFNETFDFGSDRNAEEPNKWLPEHLISGFHEFSNEFYSECWQVTQKILRALALGLSMPEDSIEKYHSYHRNSLSYKHYPAVSSSDFLTHEKERLGPHSDMTSLTLLFQDECGGLEVETPGARGKFFPVDPIEGTLIMNIGDILMRWSNDSLLSTVHRVQPPPLKEAHSSANQMTPARYSIPYFVQPKTDAIIECLPGCFDESDGVKYPPRSYRELVVDYSKLFYPEAVM